METKNKYPLYEIILASDDINAYITEQNLSMKALGYTEHSFAHVGLVTERTKYILEELGEDAHTIDLALVSARMHDMGNIVNRTSHSQTGALMAFTLLNKIPQFTPEDIARIICAIGNHDEGTGVPVSTMAAALILADKSDVRRSRVQNPDEKTFDIHDRVNYSAVKSQLKINQDHTAIKLKLSIDTSYGEIGEYFEIFMKRMLMCRQAADYLHLQFHLIINEQTLM
jgi:metal-dependent HD superfamily phosphatase/phosphodiesterase